MSLSSLQKDVLRCIASNRSQSSYFAGGLVLNKDWPRRSDDVDIFHDTDEEIGESAGRDIASLRLAGFRVSVDIEIYGLTEAIVSAESDSTVLQWMSETRTRFFPLVRDAEWGARLHMCDLAVNKVIAASTRSKARDFVDLVSIAAHFCPLGPLLLAAAGKPPHFSPQRTIDEIRRRGLLIANEDYDSIKGMPETHNAGALRADLIAALDQAEQYIQVAPIGIVGILVTRNGIPAEVGDDIAGCELRKTTAEQDVMPSLPELSPDWAKPDRP